MLNYDRAKYSRICSTGRVVWQCVSVLALSDTATAPIGQTIQERRTCVHHYPGIVTFYFLTANQGQKEP